MLHKVIVPGESLITFAYAVSPRTVDIAALVRAANMASDVGFARERLDRVAMDVEAVAVVAVGSLVV